MWSLKNLKGQGESVQFLVNKEYTVGRKNADVLISNDPSISRTHATVKVKFIETNLNKPLEVPELVVTDASKLGTEVNNERFVQTFKPAKPNDIILFGTTGDSKYQARYEPCVITTSCIAASVEKRAVKSLIARLGGHQVSEWRKECTHLVMSNLSVTVKVICALISQKPIVTPLYLKDFITAVEEKKTPPSSNSPGYLPPLSESQLEQGAVSFAPNPQRQTLLNGKIFIFLSTKQFKKLSLTIELAGGVPMLMEEGNPDNDDALLAAPGTCVMSNDAVDATQMTQTERHWTRHVIKHLKKHHKRLITDPEIGFAILYCSIEKHCNPDSPLDDSERTDPTSQSVSEAPMESVTAHEILAPNTEFDATIVRPNNTSMNTTTNITHVDDTEAIIYNKDANTRKSSAATETAPIQDTYSKVGEKAKKTAKNIYVPAVSDIMPISPVEKAKKTAKNLYVPAVSDIMPISPITKNTPKRSFEKQSDIVDDFDAIPKRRCKRSGHTQQEDDDVVFMEPITDNDDFETLSKQVVTPDVLIVNPVAAGAAKPTASEPVSNSTDFDAIPSRPKKRNKPDDFDALANEVSFASDFDDIPARKSRRRRTDKDDDVVATPSTSRTQNGRDATAGVKQGVSEATAAASPASQPAVSRDTTDFLSTHNVDLSKVKLTDCVKDENQLVSCLVVSEKSLVARRPGEYSRPAKDSGNAKRMWRGKIVNNFKKFRKCLGRSDEGLPQIIGGGDLVVHDNSLRPELDEWFNEEIQAQSQRQQLEKDMNTLFEFDQITARKRRR